MQEKQTENKEPKFQKSKKYFYRMFSGQFISMITTQIVQYSLIWYLTNETKSPTILAMATLVAFLPGVIFGPFVGSFIDRMNKKVLLIGADWIVALVAVWIFFLGNETSVDSEIIIVFIGLFIRSFAGVIQQPTMQSVIPTLVPEDFVPKVGGIYGVASSLIMLVSPAIGATLYAMTSLGNIMLLDVIGAIFGTIAVLITPIVSFTQANGEKIQVFKDLKFGWKLLKKQKGIFSVTVWSSLITLLVMPAFSMYPLITTKYFGGTIIDASFVETSWAIGTLLGGAFIGIFAKVKNRFNILAYSFVIAGISFMIAGFLPGNKIGMYIFMGLNIFSGIGFMIGTGLYNSLVQQAFKAQDLGRVISITTTIMMIAGPIGLIFAGPLENIIGLNGLILIAGIGMTIFTILNYMDKNARSLNNLKVQTDK